MVADAAHLPFATATFDVVVMAFMLFHVPEPTAALRQVHHVLRIGGRVCLTTWGRDSIIPALEIWFCEPRVDFIAWSHRPTLEEFLRRHVALGATGRRLAGLSTHARTAFVREARSRLEKLAPDDFVDRSEVIGATAVAG